MEVIFQGGRGIGTAYGGAAGTVRILTRAGYAYILNCAESTDIIIILGRD